MASSRLLCSRIQHQQQRRCLDANSKLRLVSLSKMVRCSTNNHNWDNGERRGSSEVNGKRTSQVSANAMTVAASEALCTRVVEAASGGVNVDPAILWATAVTAVLTISRVAVNQRPTTLQLQMFIERVIVDCRFFTFLAVAGSLLGSGLCFVEGCFMILESYFQYFHSISQSSDHGSLVQLVLEAIDMFLVGTAMLIFGVGLYVMFVGSKSNERRYPQQIPKSNLFGLFHLKMLPSWLEMQSVTQAKSRIGHAIMMLLQVGVLEKLKSIPLVTALDLACFAGAVLISSACIFLLSKLCQ
ncbi:hypothetical protein Ancab_035978 [Ancistrocladus abbreviatus]